VAAIVAISLPLMMTYHEDWDYVAPHSGRRSVSSFLEGSKSNSSQLPTPTASTRRRRKSSGSTPALNWYHHYNVRISYGLWHICVKGLPTLENKHVVKWQNASVPYYTATRGDCWDDYCCEATKDYANFGNLAWNFPVSPEHRDDWIEDREREKKPVYMQPGSADFLGHMAGWYDNIVTVQCLYVSATVVLFIASCSAGAVYHSPQAGFVSSFLHFSAGVLFLAAGSYTVDKIKRPDDMHWNFTFVWTWIAWLFTWITAALSAMAAMEAGKDDHDSERQPLGSSKQHGYSAAKTGSA
jgi:hypothetical protein